MSESVPGRGYPLLRPDRPGGGLLPGVRSPAGTPFPIAPATGEPEFVLSRTLPGLAAWSLVERRKTLRGRGKAWRRRGMDR